MVDQPGADGGVRSTRLLADPTSVQQYDPSAPDADADGLVNRPNVDLARETVDQIAGQRQFEANLATVRAADELLRATRDIKSSRPRPPAPRFRPTHALSDRKRAVSGQKVPGQVGPGGGTFM